MVTHSSILAWKISWTREPGGLQSMGFAMSQIRLKWLSTAVLYRKERVKISIYIYSVISKSWVILALLLILCVLLLLSEVSDCFCWRSVRKTGISYNFVLLSGCLQITLEPGGVKEDQPSVFNFTMSMVQSQRTVTWESQEPAGNCCWLHSIFISWDEWMAGKCKGCWKTCLCEAHVSGAAAGGTKKWLVPPLLLSHFMLMQLRGRT